MTTTTTTYTARHSAAVETTPRRIVRAIVRRIIHSLDEIAIVLTLHVAAVALYYKFGEPIVDMLIGGSGH